MAQSNPILPTDKTIDEVARRVMYKSLVKLDKMLDDTTIKLETTQTLAMVVQAASEGMLPPDGSEDDD